MTDQVTFKITVPHTKNDRGMRCEWFFPVNGWRGGPIERRDRAGRLQGTRRGWFPEWFVLICNNPDCLARAVVPVKVLTDFADTQDPDTRPRRTR